MRSLEMVFFVQVTDGCSWREALVLFPRRCVGAQILAHYKTIHTHSLMKISALQLPIYSSAWSNRSFTELMRKWTKIKESFGCCISSREEAAVVFLLRVIISQLQPAAAPTGARRGPRLPLGMINIASKACCVSGGKQCHQWSDLFSFSSPNFLA